MPSIYWLSWAFMRAGIKFTCLIIIHFDNEQSNQEYVTMAIKNNSKVSQTKEFDINLDKLWKAFNPDIQYCMRCFYFSVTFSLHFKTFDCSVTCSVLEPQQRVLLQSSSGQFRMCTSSHEQPPHVNGTLYAC